MDKYWLRCEQCGQCSDSIADKNYLCEVVVAWWSGLHEQYLELKENLVLTVNGKNTNLLQFLHRHRYCRADVWIHGDGMERIPAGFVSELARSDYISPTDWMPDLAMV